MFHSLDVLSPCELPRTGAAILVCNHTSGLDPYLIQSVSRRLITWMMAKEYFDLPVLNRMFRAVGAIPVARSGRDTAATRAAMRALQRGEVLGIFPEGRIEESPELLPFQTGVAMMAIKTGVPVYAAYLDGTQRGKDVFPAVLSSNKAIIRFGGPIDFDRRDSSRAALDAATAAIQQAVQALADQTPVARYRNHAKIAKDA
jgi:1-acyl-sn-glycerol-3-phosphate acyltransferase